MEVTGTYMTLSLDVDELREAIGDYVTKRSAADGQQFVPAKIIFTIKADPLPPQTVLIPLESDKFGGEITLDVRAKKSLTLEQRAMMVFMKEREAGGDPRTFSNLATVGYLLTNHPIRDAVSSFLARGHGPDCEVVNVLYLIAKERRSTLPSRESLRQEGMKKFAHLEARLKKRFGVRRINALKAQMGLNGNGKEPKE